MPFHSSKVPELHDLQEQLRDVFWNIDEENQKYEKKNFEGQFKLKKEIKHNIYRNYDEIKGNESVEFNHEVQNSYYQTKTHGSINSSIISKYQKD